MSPVVISCKIIHQNIPVNYSIKLKMCHSIKITTPNSPIGCQISTLKIQEVPKGKGHRVICTLVTGCSYRN